MNEYDKNLELNNKIDGLKKKIDPALLNFSQKKFLHTSPHHDDIMLGYLPVVQYLVLNTPSINHFAVMTGGFNSVADEYLMQNLENLEEIIKNLEFRLNCQSILMEVLSDLVRTELKITQDQFTVMLRDKALMMYGDTKYLN